MSAAEKIGLISPTLTDFSFIQYRYTPDLYEMLLSDTSQQLELFQLFPHEPSLERQPTRREAVEGKGRVDCSETEEAESKAVTTHCNCSKSKCSKNYCECFRLGRKCSAECSCNNCSNWEDHLHRVVRPAQAAGGCNCKKSHCQKKYCECHSRGIKCGPQCHCLNCENIEAEAVAAKAPENPFGVIDGFFK